MIVLSPRSNPKEALFGTRTPGTSPQYCNGRHRRRKIPVARLWKRGRSNGGAPYRLGRAALSHHGPRAGDTHLIVGALSRLRGQRFCVRLQNLHGCRPRPSDRFSHTRAGAAMPSFPAERIERDEADRLQRVKPLGGPGFTLEGRPRPFLTGRRVADRRPGPRRTCHAQRRGSHRARRTRLRRP